MINHNVSTSSLPPLPLSPSHRGSYCSCSLIFLSATAVPSIHRLKLHLWSLLAPTGTECKQMNTIMRQRVYTTLYAESCCWLCFYFRPSTTFVVSAPPTRVRVVTFGCSNLHSLSCNGFSHVFLRKQLRHLCNYFGDTLRGRGSDTISIHCTVNLKVMFAAYSNGNESICFESRLKIWGQSKHDVVRMLFQQKHYTVYAKTPDAVSHNVISVMLQIRASDLRSTTSKTPHRSSARQEKPESNRLTDSHIFTGAHRMYVCMCVCVRLYLQVCKHANMITSRSPCLSLPSLLTSDKDDSYLPGLQLPVYIQSTV